MLATRARGWSGDVPNHNERRGDDNRCRRPDHVVACLAHSAIRMCCAVKMKVRLLKSSANDQQYSDEYNTQIPHQRRSMPDLTLLAHT